MTDLERHEFKIQDIPIFLCPAPPSGGDPEYVSGCPVNSACTTMQHGITLTVGGIEPPDLYALVNQLRQIRPNVKQITVLTDPDHLGESVNALQEASA